MGVFKVVDVKEDKDVEIIVEDGEGQNNDDMVSFLIFLCTKINLILQQSTWINSVVGITCDECLFILFL